MKKTRIAQIVYAAVMGVDALLIFLFQLGTPGVPYAFPLGILISVVLTVCPVHLVCLFLDAKRYFQSDRQAADKKEMMWSVLWFVILCIAWILLDSYGNRYLVGVV